MSKTWKGWLGVATHYSKHGGSPHRRVYVDNPDVGVPVIVCPIDDESLPHPGDGREWERDGDRVTITGVPHRDRDGSVWVAAVDGDGGLLFSPVHLLRERKPEPEHKPWCGYDPTDRCVESCTCERRCGKDRRQGERRAKWRDWMTDQGGRRGSVNARRRSGTDRRSS